MTASEPAPFAAALCQLSSGADLAANLAAAADALDEAAAGKAALACLPELWPCMSANESVKLAAAEQDGSGPAQDLLAAKASEHSMHVLGGSVPLASKQAGRIVNACLLYGPDGTRIARYDKIHLFRFDAADRRYDETATCTAGSRPVWADTALGRIGLSVCYDLRFPEMFRSLSEPDIIVAPSAFTVQTGQAHWEVLVRARAVENLCHVLAPAQCGTHAGGLRTWGHSLAVAPWGEVLADGGSEPGVTMVAIDPAATRAARERLPVLADRVL